MSAARLFLVLLAAVAVGLLGFLAGRTSDEPATPLQPSPSVPRPERPDPACGGSTPERTGGGTWSCTFSDEFTGATLDTSKWTVLETADSQFTNGGECFVDTPENVAVSDGSLHLTVRREDDPVSCPGLQVAPTTPYTSGSVTTTTKFAQAYGRFEIRARFPTASVSGLHSALWLWPQEQDRYGPRPASGEIDIAEHFTAYPDRVIPYLHYNAADPALAVTNNECRVDEPDSFHVYVLEWTPRRITISYDDAVCLDTTWQAQGLVPPAPFDVPFFVNLTQALGSTTNPVSSETQLPATMDVDYVRVWS